MSASSSRPRKGRGRKKVNMAKIENEANLQVSFSKRKCGAFKKASELCTLTGAEAAVVVFSPMNKAYSFGSPDVNTIANRFTNPNAFPPHNQLPQFHGRFSTQQYNDAETIVQADKNRAEELDRLMGTPAVPALFPPSGEISPQVFELLTSSAQNVDQMLDLHKQNANNTIGGNYPFGMPSGSNAAGPSNQGTIDQGNMNGGYNIPQGHNPGSSHGFFG